jgi:hypothetical protein
MTNWKPTNRNHALVVIIQVLLNNLKQRSNRSSILRFRSALQTQELILNFHLREGARQSSDDGLVRDLVDLDTNHNAEIEHELIAFILLVLDANRMTKDAVLVIRVTNCDISVAECLSWNYILGHGLEVKETRFVYTWLGDNASWRALVDNLRTCEMSGIFHVNGNV